MTAAMETYTKTTLPGLITAYNTEVGKAETVLKAM